MNFTHSSWARPGLPNPPQDFYIPDDFPLTPRKAALYAELRELSLCFFKVQAELYLHRQAPAAHALKLAEAPLWQALGIREARPERPWLAKRFSFLVWDGA
jgi:hypothetical protein